MAEQEREQEANQERVGARNEITGRYTGTALAILATAFSCGAVVILIEILGTRVIGPVFGVNLFVWSALLATTLGSLALGYYAGGVWIDRSPRLHVLAYAVLASGILLSAVPLLAHPVLGLGESMGPAVGSVVSAAILFAPCLTVLGTIGPIAVRLSTLTVGTTGHRVGYVYALSTAGSLLGTFVTGFVLIPSFDTHAILFGASFFLAGLGTSLLVIERRLTPMGLAAIPLIAAFALPSYALPQGFRLLSRTQSLYGLVEVIDDDARQVRFLRVDHSVIGAQFLQDHSSAFSFIHLLEVARLLRPKARQALEIGLGTGALPTALQAHGLVVDAVEIDPAVVQAAERYFGYTPTGDVVEQDARLFLRQTTKRYDIVVHDTFTGGSTPEHLLSLEVLRRIHDVLTPEGVLVLNFVGYQDGPNAEASRLVKCTLSAAFTRVRVFGDGPRGTDSAGAGNIVFFATDGPLDFAIPIGERFESEAAARVRRSFLHWEVLEDVSCEALVTDEHNPLARLQLPVAYEHFDAMNKLLPPEIWLH